MKSQSSTTKYFILSELTRKDMHGYELITRLEKITGKKPSPSQVYPVLKRMRALGYVVVKEGYSGKKKVKYYRLAKRGRQFFDSMHERFELIIRSALKGKIKVCAHCGCEIFKGAYGKKISGKQMYFCCTSCADSYRI